MRVAVAGAGIFGVTAALELARRGHRVSVVDPGPLPHPLAESTDISKVVRIDYGGDVEYMVLAERALEGWRRWSRGWPDGLFHETGVVYLARDEMKAGGFEHESFALAGARGHRVERLDRGEIARRFPAFRAGAFADGYYNPQGGWVEASAVVARLVDEARAAGVAVRGGCRARRVIERGGRAGGLELDDGGVIEAERVIVAAGAWAGQICPALAGALRASGQPVFHLRPARAALYQAERFPVFCDDIARTGYYGFPIAREGLVKIANHGPGAEVDMRGAERVVSRGEEEALREYLRDVLPDLAGAEIAFRRQCVYGDTKDGHFWMAEDPELPGLVAATGGSGHGFKFAPVLGGLIADAAVGPGLPPALEHRFRWRPELEGEANQEAARFRGAPRGGQDG